MGGGLLISDPDKLRGYADSDFLHSF